MAITMGDASGVGPEIVLRRAADGALQDGSVVVYGDAAILEHGRDLLGLDVSVRVVDSPADAQPGQLCVVDAGLLAASDHRPGQLDARVGRGGPGLRRRRHRRLTRRKRGGHGHDADQQGSHPAHRSRRSSATPSSSLSAAVRRR